MKPGKTSFMPRLICAQMAYCDGNGSGEATLLGLGGDGEGTCQEAEGPKGNSSEPTPVLQVRLVRFFRGVALV